jgi:dipeptidyl aminopeptidase
VRECADGSVTITTTPAPHRYNGPGAQQVNLRFNRDWNSILPTNHQYIVVIVDGRGTGFKGRRLRNPVKNNLGFFETRDQVNAAK